MPCANGIWSVGGRNWNEDFEMSADDRNCTSHFGVDTFYLALHGADDYRTYLEIELTKGKREVTEDDEREADALCKQYLERWKEEQK